MSVRDRFWSASSTMLALHVVRTLFALALLDPFYRELTALLSRGDHARAGGISNAELALESVLRTGSYSWPWLLFWLSLYALLAPLLAQSWMQALCGARGLLAAVRAAAPRYLLALAARALLLVGFALCAGASTAIVDRLIAVAPASAALEQALRAGLWLSFGLLAAVALVVHDFALARIATGARLWAALRFGLAHGAAVRLLRLALALGAGAGLIVLADLLGRAEPAWPGTLWPSTLLALQQTLLLCALAARGAWLAYAASIAINPPRS